MATISKEEFDELILCDGIMQQVTQGISGRIQNLSMRKYGIPRSVGTFYQDMSHAGDLDVVQWGRWCVQDACADKDSPMISPTGSTSLYGALMSELCRRLAWWAYRAEEARTVAWQPTGAVAP